MTNKLFQYSQGYDYQEFSAMCDRFQNVNLLCFPYDVASALSEYVFGYSMQRFPTGKKNVLRRFLGAMFCYPMSVIGEGATAFLFTGDGIGRPDYLDCLRAAAGQCENASLWIMDRRKPQLRAKCIFGMGLVLLWALRLNRVVHHIAVSLDLATGLYRAKNQGEAIFHKMQAKGIQKLVTFCDAWSTEGVTTQLAKKIGIPTATLQHGNGTEILYRSCSDYYLANSLLSRENCLIAGMPTEKIVVTGPMKYAGQEFACSKITKVQRMGVVFDGAQNFENNIEMLNVVHDAIADTDVRCYLRFHPNNRREDYGSYLLPSDVVCDDLAEFERTIDFCVVYNSSMFTDMIFKRIPVCRFKNGKVDLFPQLQDTGFRDANTLRAILSDVTSAPDALYEQVFGADCGSNRYRRFFDEKM